MSHRPPSDPAKVEIFTTTPERPPEPLATALSILDETPSDKKDTSDEPDTIFLKISVVCDAGPTVERILHSFNGEVELPEPAKNKAKRRSPGDVPWHEKRHFEGYKKGRCISKSDREGAVAAADRARGLGFPFRVLITLNPGIDHLGPVERMHFWDRFVNKLRSHCTWRRKATGKAFPCVFIAVRESDAITNMGEHLHMLAHAPNRTEAEHLARLASGWCLNAHAKLTDSLERFRHGKLRSVIAYCLKAASPQSRRADPTILFQPSGAIVGPRVRISKNLTNYEVIVATEAGVQTMARMREERPQADRRRRLWAHDRS